MWRGFWSRGGGDSKLGRRSRTRTKEFVAAKVVSNNEVQSQDRRIPNAIPRIYIEVACDAKLSINQVLKGVLGEVIIKPNSSKRVEHALDQGQVCEQLSARQETGHDGGQAQSERHHHDIRRFKPMKWKLAMSLGNGIENLS